jgi:hypothetical protein
MVLAWVLSEGTWMFPDTGRYLQAAANLNLHGELYAWPWTGDPPQGKTVQEYTIRTLGYPLVVLLLGSAAGQPVWLLLVQNLWSLLNIGVVLTWWARIARPNVREWLVPLLAVITFPAQLIYANAVMSELMLQTLVLGMVVGSLAYLKTQKIGYLAGVAVAMVLALLTKPVFYPLAILFVATSFMLARRARQKRIIAIGMLPVLVALLYMGWNKSRTGFFHFSSIAEINLLHYNAAGVVRQTRGAEGEEQWVAEVLREANAQPDFAGRQQLIRSRAGAVIWAHPVVYARQHLQGMLALFLDPGRFDISQVLGTKNPASEGFLAQARAGGLVRAVRNLPLGMLAWLGVVLLANTARLALAVRGMVLLGKEGPMLRHGRWVAASLLLYVSLLTGPLGAARFLVPVWPLLLGLALFGWQQRPHALVARAEVAPPLRKNQG